ncbi:SGNH/GDSL hydrolase family protein [Aspergillus stella-maris]|uniref:SGNH/GDSL hydrolase family protein n=1 Tax=Aspergillus stella-maris TaxID=1810926 RepID=UPI003CCCF663
MRNIIPVSQTSTALASITASLSRFVILLTFLTLSLPTVFASPFPPNIPSADNVSLQHTPRASKPFLLRVMPLGASITVGYRSTDGNGYRKYLREQLRYAGWEIDMVGSLSNGTMKDYQNEGHFGKTIDQVANAAVDSAGMQPNVVLINVGTNDGIQNVHITGAGDRINSLITDLTSRIPNVTVILSTLIPNTIAQRVIERLSAEYRNVAARRRSNGDRVILAEMSYFIDSSRLVDGTHPDDQGYKEMAAVWWAAIQEAEDEGFLSAPNDVTNRMASVLKGNSTAEGEGLDDGPVSDPELPAYVAPAQPGNGDTGDAAGGGFNWKGVWVILGVQVLALATLMG